MSFFASFSLIANFILFHFIAANTNATFCGQKQKQIAPRPGLQKTLPRCVCVVVAAFVDDHTHTKQLLIANIEDKKVKETSQSYRGSRIWM